MKSLQSQLSQLPEGKLTCCSCGKHVKWYQSHGSSRTYIPKKNRHLAEKLAFKNYLVAQTQQLLLELKAIKQYLKYYEPSNIDKEFLSETSVYSDLLAPVFTPLSAELQIWMNSPYKKNSKHPEQLVHKTLSGILVRSKSEAIIAMMLHKYKIPFQYECELTLGDFDIYPDFTIRHPKTGEFFYFEHFGMMDDPEYSHKAFAKLQLYANNGIYPSLRLLTTYETNDNPLDSNIVEKMISHYFL